MVENKVEVGKIFISYRSTEGKFAIKIVERLVANGIGVWMDQLRGIQPGDDWPKQLQQGIDQAVGMLCMLSPAYTQSSYCLRELNRADGKYPIIPVLIEDVAPTDLPMELQRIQQFNFRNWETISDKDFNNEVDTLTIRIKSEMPDSLLETNLHEDLQVYDNQMVHFRRLEEKMIVDSSKATPTISSTFAKLKHRKLTERLELAHEQYIAVYDRLLLSTEAYIKPVLERQIQKIEADIKEIETELAQLQL